MPIQDAINAIIAKYKAAFADRKITFTEAVGLVYEAVRQIVAVTETLVLPGPDKKKAAMDALGLFIDQVITPLDLVPNIRVRFIDDLVERATDATVKASLLRFADDFVEVAVNLFNVTGWPKVSE